MWEGFHGNVFPISRLTDFFQEAILDQEVELVSEKHCEYFNIPSSFDIETTSWSDGKYEDGREVHLATMYIWQFGLNGSVIYGRTWDEFGTLLQYLHENLGLSENRHLVIYVHNLGYEFQFMRKYFDWDKVFAIKTRRPVYAISGGFEFRCSLFLSNYALEYIGDNLLVNYKVEKMEEDKALKLEELDRKWAEDKKKKQTAGTAGANQFNNYKSSTSDQTIDEFESLFLQETNQA